MSSRSVNAISVASLYVAVRSPVSRIATTRWPSRNGSTACPPVSVPGCRTGLSALLPKGDTDGRLVRDRIPEIIRRSGRRPRVTTLDEQACRKALHDKLLEEAAELRVAHCHDEAVELADVVEIVVALAATYDLTPDTITGAARRERAERGGFEMRLRLKDTDPKLRTPWC